jgi:hypothetical protein
MSTMDDYDFKQAKIQGYRECMDILRDLSDHAEYNNNRPADAKLLRDAMLVIHQHHDALVRSNYTKHPERYIAGLQADKSGC